MLIKDNLHYFLVTRKLMASRIMMMMIEVKWDNIQKNSNQKKMHTMDIGYT